MILINQEEDLALPVSEETMSWLKCSYQFGQYHLIIKVNGEINNVGSYDSEECAKAAFNHVIDHLADDLVYCTVPRDGTYLTEGDSEDDDD